MSKSKEIITEDFNREAKTGFKLSLIAGMVRLDYEGERFRLWKTAEFFNMILNNGTNRENT